MSPPVGDSPPPPVEYTSKVASTLPEIAPVSSTTWLPSSVPFGTDHVNVTSPLSSATEVPMSYGVEYCVAVTDSPGWKPWPWATCVSPTCRRSFSSSIEICWPSEALDAFAFEADSLSEAEFESLSDAALSSDDALAEADASLSDEAAASEEASDDESALDAACDAAAAFALASDAAEASAFDADEASAFAAA